MASVMTVAVRAAASSAVPLSAKNCGSSALGSVTDRSGMSQITSAAKDRVSGRNKAAPNRVNPVWNNTSAV
jgi:Ca2+-dependent lipid-binding protein